MLLYAMRIQRALRARCFIFSNLRLLERSLSKEVLIPQDAPNAGGLKLFTSEDISTSLGSAEPANL